MGLFSKKKEPVYFTLDRLALIWLDPAIVRESSTLRELETRKWVNPSIQKFWNDCVLPNARLFQENKLLVVVQSALIQLEDTADFSSINIDDPEINDTQRVYLKDVTLWEHTLNVTEKTIELLKNHPEGVRGRLAQAIIAALSHDLGVPHGKSNVAHSLKSAEWLRRQFEDESAEMEMVEAVRLHHQATTNNIQQQYKSNPILVCLMLADKEIRQAELNLAMSKPRPVEKPDPAPPEPETGKTIVVQPPTVIEPPDIQRDQDRAFVLGDITTEIKNILEKPEPLGVETVSGEGPMELDLDTEQQKNTNNDRSLWLTGDVLLNEIKPKITANGFDAFYHDGKVFVRPMVVKDAILEMARKHGDANYENILKNYLDLVTHEAGFENRQARLKMMGKMPPVKGYYFICDAEKFRLSDELKDLPPRDDQGRFLKQVSIFD